MDENREFAQGELVRGILTALHRAAPDDHLPFFGATARRLIDRLPGTGGSTEPDDAGFASLVVEPIEAFTAIAAERGTLYAALLESVVASLTARAHSRWQAHDLGLDDIYRDAS